jgi:hypothetical protein
MKKTTTKGQSELSEASTPAVQWYGENGGMVRLEEEIAERGTWGNVEDPLFQEFVAREHLEGNMPIEQLHRGHEIPLASIQKWIEVFKAMGRAGLENLAKEKD